MKRVFEQSDLIIIRNTQEQDLDFVYNTEHESENAQYVGQWEIEQHISALSQRDILHLTVEDVKAHNRMGYVIIAGLENPNNSIELKRIVISEKGKGFGRETLKLVKRVAFNQLKAHRLWLDVRYNNHRAQSLYKSERFFEEGVLRDCIFYNGEYESLIVMSILKNEWKTYSEVRND